MGNTPSQKDGVGRVRTGDGARDMNKDDMQRGSSNTAYQQQHHQPHTGTPHSYGQDPGATAAQHSQQQNLQHQLEQQNLPWQYSSNKMDNDVKMGEPNPDHSNTLLSNDNSSSINSSTGRKIQQLNMNSIELLSLDDDTVPTVFRWEHGGRQV